MIKDSPLLIKFTPPNPNYEGVLVPPEPAIRHIPEWYRSLARHNKSNDESTLGVTNSSGTDGAQVHTKMCMPFFDALTAGYVFLLEDDLIVDLDENGKPMLSWGGRHVMVDHRSVTDLVVPNNCHPIHYGWKMSWYYETPPGYSVLITHPMNRYDLPFIVQSGIVESDIWGLPVFIAFFLRKDFRGVIPKGTPIFQMIPFKRDDWEMTIDISQEAIENHEFKAERRRSLLYGYYKKTTWIRKIFGVLNQKSRKEDDHEQL